MAKYSINYSFKIDFRGIWGLGFIVTVVFLILKLCNQIAWGWFWVFSPLVAAAALYCLILIGFIIFIIFNRIRNLF